jgi:hypothetical protein
MQRTPKNQFLALVNGNCTGEFMDAPRISREHLLAPGTPSLSPHLLFAPQQVEELKREDVRFAAPFDPYAKMAEATRQLFQPEPATARVR